MDNPTIKPEPDSSAVGVFELPGEPAVVINGVPNISPSGGAFVPPGSGNANVDSEFLGGTGFGEWVEGREVRKLFGGQYYSGTVTLFDKEAGWYRVVYDDGDFEDLDWNELQEVLQPIDVAVPLKSLALKVIKKTQKSNQKSGRSTARSPTKSKRLI